MYTNIQPLTLGSGASILDAVKVLDAGGKQVALIVNDQGRLIGTVTDGDIRRGLLRGTALTESVGEVMCLNPITALLGERPETVRQIMRSKGIRQMPVLDGAGRPSGLAVLNDDEITDVGDTLIVLMAGGMGTRLRPLTENVPKPMLPVGDKPLLEVIIRNFTDQGFRRFSISVNYRREVIESYFGDGSEFGCEIDYLVETNRLGTAGALGLMDSRPEQPFLVMNGDLLTSANFATMLEHHRAHDALATVGAREYSFEVPFGVIEFEDSRLLQIVEKPVHRHLVNAGIYVLSPQVLGMFERGQRLDMPDLLARVVADGGGASVFPLREYWLDIGVHSDLERARLEFDGVFGK